MTDTILVTHAEIDVVRKLATSINFDAECKPVIRIAQDMDIRPALGDVMYYHLLDNVADPDYDALLNGANYENVDGETVSFRGLKHALICFFWSRHIINPSKSTPFGEVIKQSGFSDTTDPKLLFPQSNQWKLDGKQYLLDCITYIERMRDTENKFPKYNKGKFKRLPNSSVRYTTI